MGIIEHYSLRFGVPSCLIKITFFQSAEVTLVMKEIIVTFLWCWMNLGPDQSTPSIVLEGKCGAAISPWNTSNISDYIPHVHSKHTAQELNLCQLCQWKGLLSSYAICAVLEFLCLLSAFPSEPCALPLPTASLSLLLGACARSCSQAAVLLLKDRHSSAGCEAGIDF